MMMATTHGAGTRLETGDAAPAAGRTISRQSCPYRARAWWAGQLVAESTAAVVVRETGQEPVLYFPRSDVRFDLFEDTGEVVCPVKGTGRRWSGEASTSPVARGGWAREDAGGDPAGTTAVDGRDLAWCYSQPAPELGWLAELAAFDHDRVRVELVDATDDTQLRDVTVKRFPTWGDAADLIDIMNVRPVGDDHYVSVALADVRRPVVEASQMLGQAIVAAGRRAPGRRVVSAHMVFHRAADAREPLEFTLTEVSSGRSFTTLTARVAQNGRGRAIGTLLLDATAADVVRHGGAPPACPGPYDSEPYDMSVLGRDIRMVDGGYSEAPDAPIGPPEIDAWVRFRSVPADPCLHAGLLAQFTGHLSIAAALRPHAAVSQNQAHRSLSMGINAISISLHADVRADRWLRYHHRSTFAGDGMTHSVCDVHTESQELVASFTVDAMVRAFPGGGHADDDRTAL
ncbi:DUF427 domain-containing protein [Frankia sp. AgB32]|uniref:DUF427 domain-containing protein n=1 Tax=Frankia sp. AgB32 TaxID=631119 RepID=UPI00200DFEE2|nr:DUF427 domain-containing protein [Frankia sp. AgB32]MCK9897774.1 thioesterase family protein [Frankia sp. AgB32]